MSRNNYENEIKQLQEDIRRLRKQLDNLLDQKNGGSTVQTTLPNDYLTRNINRISDLIEQKKMQIQRAERGYHPFGFGLRSNPYCLDF